MIRLWGDPPGLLHISKYVKKLGKEGATPADILLGLGQTYKIDADTRRGLLRLIHNGPLVLCSDGKVRHKDCIDGKD
jgi:hypothetical protein